MSLFSPHPKAYVVSIFEIEEGHVLPQNKSQLLEMMDDKVVIPFHARYCPECHRIPGAEKWIQDPGKGTRHILAESPYFYSQ